MRLSFELTPEQLDELAERVADHMGKQKPAQKDTYTIKEAATRMDVHQVTIRRRVKAGTIPIIPGLGAIRIPASYVEAALTQK